jgi:hypothetical protein
LILPRGAGSLILLELSSGSRLQTSDTGLKSSRHCWHNTQEKETKHGDGDASS